MEQRFNRSILLSVMLLIFLIRADFSVYICLNPYSILFQALISIKRYCLANEIGLSVLPTAFYMFLYFYNYAERLFPSVENHDLASFSKYSRFLFRRSTSQNSIQYRWLSILSLLSILLVFW